MSRLPRISGIQDESSGSGFYLCARKELRTDRAGASFLAIVLQDMTGQIGAKLFDRADAASCEFEAGEFVKIEGRANRHRDRLELVLDRIRRVHPDQDRPDGFREADCIPCAPRPLDEMWRELQERIAAVGNPWIRQLLDAVVQPRADRLRVWPAAVTVHHAYRGGLLEHILSIAAAVTALADVYGVDRDLLLAGAILHDIGKLDELTYDLTASYSRDGNLVGHITLGAGIVRQAAAGIAGFPSDLRARIEHLVVSHHGERELGSPVEPMTPEAFVLSAIDGLDAQLHQVRRHLTDDRGEGEFTSYHPRLGRVLLKPSGR